MSQPQSVNWLVECKGVTIDTHRHGQQLLVGVTNPEDRNLSYAEARELLSKALHHLGPESQLNVDVVPLHTSDAAPVEASKVCQFVNTLRCNHEHNRQVVASLEDAGCRLVRIHVHKGAPIFAARLPTQNDAEWEAWLSSLPDEFRV